MKTGIWMILTLMAVGTVALADGRNPGSCILFPYFDTSGETMSIHTITNTGTEDVWIRLVFVEGQSCKPIDFFWPIEHGDTFTFGAHGILPGKMTGFLYAYVVKGHGQVEEKKADVLVGQEIVLGVWDSRLVHFSMNAQCFQAIKPVEDGKLHLDGKEYTRAPKTLYFPRFFGQDGALYSRVILINLTGGMHFTVYADFTVCNDNGNTFVDHVSFDCFQLEKLEDLSAFTKKAFLLTTGHHPQEPHPFYALAETGTLRITGTNAVNKDLTVVIPNPSVYAVLVEGFGTLGYTGADLPLQIDDPNEYNNAMLWSTDPSGH